MLFVMLKYRFPLSVKSILHKQKLFFLSRHIPLDDYLEVTVALGFVKRRPIGK